MTPTARILVNPAARRPPPPQQLRDAVAWLERQGWSVEMMTVPRIADVRALAREAAHRGYTAVVACGGDGTVNLVAESVAGSETGLAVIPGGTTNVWCLEAGIPRQPLRALRLLLQGQQRRIDLGCVSGLPRERVFLLMAGIGLDGEVVRRVSPTCKRRLGAAAFALSAACTALQSRPHHTLLRADGQAYAAHLLQLVLGNTRLYGGIARITPTALADDGLLDLCLYQGEGLAQIAQHTLWTLLAMHPGRKGVLYRRVREVEVLTPGLPIQIDGDYAGNTPATFRIWPAALTVYLPVNAHLPFLTRS